MKAGFAQIPVGAESSIICRRKVRLDLYSVVLLFVLWCLSAFFILARWDAWVLEATLGKKQFTVNIANISPNHLHEVKLDADGLPSIVVKGSGQVLTTFKGHSGRATSAQFSPDGKFIISTGEDRTARVWETMTGKELLILNEPGTVNFANFAPDGASFITSNEDRQARVYSFPQGEMKSVLTGHEQAVRAASYSPDGERIVTASTDNTARIWDAHTGEQMAVLKPARGTFDTAQFTPDSDRVVLSFQKQTAWVWLRRHGEGWAGLSTRPEIWVFLIASVLLIRFSRKLFRQKRSTSVAQLNTYGGVQYE